MAAIVAILLRQDGRPVQDWPFPITLNSTANTLSTICRGILVSIAAEIICQTKWVWYWSDKTASRRMIDLQHFDSGSRGLVGAVKLAKLVLWHSPATLLSVFIIVFSFGMGPFVQQAIKTVGVNQADPHGRASIPVSTALSSKNGGAFFFTTQDFSDGVSTAKPFGSEDYALDPKVRGVAYAATLGTYKGNAQIVPSCTTGNCSFTGFQSGTPQFTVGKEATHASAGICNICLDVTSLIQSEDDPNGTLHKTSYKLSNGMGLERKDAMKISDGDLSWATAVMSPEVLDVSEMALANVTVLSLTSINDTTKKDDQDRLPSIAVSCSIYTCLRSYSGNVLQGELSETVISTNPVYADPEERKEDPVEFLKPKGPNLTTMRHIRKAAAPDYPSIRAPRQCVYEFDNILANALKIFIHQELFNGECTHGIRILELGGGTDFFPECKGNDWISGFWEAGNATTESIEHRFADFTNTFTNELRMGLMPADNGVSVLVTGEAYQLVSFTSIEKQWLVFPIFMVVLEVFLLGWIIARGWWRRDDEAVWKSNILPLLYYTERFRFRGTTGDDFAAWQRLMTTKEMEDGAEDVKVQFSRRGWRQHDDVSLEQMLPPQRNS
ncbi:hypothetical protein CkaCkLH20_02290 [Colletotrichum karsti]|uniref:Uncharacterized protein n=1 Tax=Colletotrichum karsti TaxID=1095194 RepID=A0A9P6LPF1_9PEZI|nr:uncharacterized protein CkaCkLH20_02290 [Colletotrichum karsti]KAF9880336.1 hypothetical protein CkaCkLH20_02290 [Colletotrichum karsti]